MPSVKARPPPIVPVAEPKFAALFGQFAPSTEVAAVQVKLTGSSGTVSGERRPLPVPVVFGI